MPEYEVLSRLRHDGREYAPGDTVTMDDEPHALRSLGVVGVEIESAPDRTAAKGKADTKARADAKAGAKPAVEGGQPGDTGATSSAGDGESGAGSAGEHQPKDAA